MEGRICPFPVVGQICASRTHLQHLHLALAPIFVCYTKWSCVQAARWRKWKLSNSWLCELRLDTNQGVNVSPQLLWPFPCFCGEQFLLRIMKHTDEYQQLNFSGRTWLLKVGAFTLNSFSEIQKDDVIRLNLRLDSAIFCLVTTSQEGGMATRSAPVWLVSRAFALKLYCSFSLSSTSY